MINVGKVSMIDIDQIEVGERARKDMGNLDELKTSLTERGLINPLAVKDIGNDKYLLLAGERRYQVLRQSDVVQVPVRIYPDDITDFEMKSIELAENFYRKDFEYWEQDSLIKEIHTLHQSEYGKAHSGVSSGWSTADTGELTGKTKSAVSTAIRRAEAREAFPELFETCKTQQDATKVMKKMDELVVKEVIAKRIEGCKKDSSISKLANSYILGDCLEYIPKLDRGVFHLVEIDPPYAIDLQKAKKLDSSAGSSLNAYNEIDKETYNIFIPTLLKQCYKVMAENSWLIMWFAPEPWAEKVYQWITEAGFFTTRMWGIWTKHSGQSKQPNLYLANSYETFYYAWKGRPVLNKAGHINEFNVPPVPYNSKVHPTERPVELMKEIYDTFAFPGSRILIPFLGSGNGIFAADELGMSAIGYDLGEEYRNSYLVRLSQRGEK